MKIAIGTVQFGCNYGIANNNGQVSLNEISSILEIGKKYNLDTLDTAVAYGDSETNLGMVGIKDWKVITKLPAVPLNCPNIESWVQATVSDSMNRLKIQHLHGILLHRPDQLLLSNGDQLFGALEKLKSDGIVQKTGISIYGPGQLDLLSGRYKFDIVQSPMNILDRRLEKSNWINKLESVGVELHARSVFLQGLLLMKDDQRPPYFSQWNSIWNDLKLWYENTGLNPLQACLQYIHAFNQVNRVVIGIDSSKQLKEILTSVSVSGLTPPESIATSDERLINPALWPL